MKQEREYGAIHIVDIEKEDLRLAFLTQLKEKTKTDLLQCKIVFGTIDEIFINEIKNAYSISIFSCCFSEKKEVPKIDFPFLSL
jgi:hypothetical protein